MRKAASPNQYTIGRVLLQEMYLLVDYERNLFQLSEALFPPAGASVELSPVQRPKGSIWPGPGSAGGQGLSTGTKVGIAVAVVGTVTGIILLIWILIRRRRGRGEKLNEDASPLKQSLVKIFSGRLGRKTGAGQNANELQADRRHPTEMVADASATRFELASFSAVEMAAEEVPGTYLQGSQSQGSMQNNDGSNTASSRPVRQASLAKDVQMVNAAEEIPAPPYAPHSGRSIDEPEQDMVIEYVSPLGDDDSHDAHLLNPGQTRATDQVVSPTSIEEQARSPSRAHSRFSWQ